LANFVYKILEFAMNKHSSLCLKELQRGRKVESSCKECLRKVHFPDPYSGEVGDYDCQNMIYYYCGRYMIRHVTEILVLLREIKEFLPRNPLIFSLGCGSCSDLLAYGMFYKKTFENDSVCYYGVDKNTLWKPIQDFIEENITDYLPNVELCFDKYDLIMDIAAVVNNIIEFKPNIISFQYVLSDMAKFYNKKDIEEFLNTLIGVAFKFLPAGSMFIFNDTNITESGKRKNNVIIRGRELLEVVEEIFIQKRNTRITKFYFPYRSTDKLLKFGKEHMATLIELSNVPEDIRVYFEIWDECRSAQLVVQKI